MRDTCDKPVVLMHTPCFSQTFLAQRFPRQTPSCQSAAAAAAATMADGTRYEEGSEFAELLKRKEFWLHSHNRTKKAFAFYDLRAEDHETSERLSVETRQPPFPLPSQCKTTPLKGTA